MGQRGIRNTSCCCLEVICVTLVGHPSTVDTRSGLVVTILNHLELGLILNVLESMLGALVAMFLLMSFGTILVAYEGLSTIAGRRVGRSNMLQQ